MKTIGTLGWTVIGMFTLIYIVAFSRPDLMTIGRWLGLVGVTVFVMIWLFKKRDEKV